MDELTHTQKFMREQHISKYKKEIDYSHLVSHSTGSSLPHNVL